MVAALPVCHQKTGADQKRGSPKGSFAVISFTAI
jgi:hypothetical protein